MGLRDSSCCCLGFSSNCFRYLYGTYTLFNCILPLKPESYCLLCLIVTVFSYTSVLFKFRFGAHPQRHCAALLRQRKLTVTLFITTLVSLLLWLPYNIPLFVVRSTDVFNSLSFLDYRRLLFSFRFLFYANSLVNPTLYTIRMPDFKKALLSLIRRHHRENVAIPLNRY